MKDVPFRCDATSASGLDITSTLPIVHCHLVGGSYRTLSYFLLIGPE